MTTTSAKAVESLPARTRLSDLLNLLYSTEVATKTSNRLIELASQFSGPAQQHQNIPIKNNGNGAMLITYADTIRVNDMEPLLALTQFLNQQIGDAIQSVHLLPFYPSSSDDGFAVTDYRRVDHHIGNWQQVAELSQHYDLMFDLVINHCSREHLWFADFIGGRDPGKGYFITLPEGSDTSAVVRPRSSPLISDVQTYAGIRHVWTTFSADQVDLDFSNPEVLVELISILFFYIQRGCGLIRLDAVAFLWKRLGSNCMSLPETHVVVKILRLLVEIAGHQTILITETNVPHEENISYYGNGDETHGVYQFSLAPLLLYSYTFGDASALTRWAQQLAPPPSGCFALNFMASHDGIGLRPLEGLIDDSGVDALVEKMHERGAFSSMRDIGNGTQRPYEINISLFSAFGGTRQSLPAYLGAHALLLAFQGMPGLYIHSLLASRNDLAKVEETGRTRSINRGTLQLKALEADLANADSVRSQVLDFLTRALRRRTEQPAFALSADQQVLTVAPTLVAFKRKSREQTILVVASVVPNTQELTADLLEIDPGDYQCELHQRDVAIDPTLTLNAYQVYWLNLTNASP